MADGRPDAQQELDHILTHMLLRRAERYHRGCGGSATGLAAGLGIASLLLGFGLRLQNGWLTLASVPAFVLLTRVFGRWHRLPAVGDGWEEELIRFASHLSGDDHLAVQPRARRQLHNRLLLADPPLALALLRLLESVGDRETLYYTDGLAQLRPEGYYASTSHPEIRYAAYRTSAVIRERLARQAPGEMLLRPVEMAAPDTLLRADAGDGQGAAERLLHPANTESPETDGR